MELEKLKSNRTIVPAVVLAILVQLFQTNNFIELNSFVSALLSLDIEKVIKLVVYIAFGYLYNNFRWRRFLFNPYLKKVQYNIKTRLLLKIDSKEIVRFSTAKEFLESRKGMDLFYKLIDNDPSLSEKSKIVKHSGALWSSLTDIAILSFVFFILELIKVVFYMDIYYSIVSIILFAVFVFALLLNHLAVKHHIELSNEQLDIIEQQFSNKLLDEYKNIEN